MVFFGANKSSWIYRFLNGSFWQSLGMICAKFLVLIVNFLLANIMGGDGYGRLIFLQNTINTSAAIASVGMNWATTKHVAEYKQNYGSLSGVISLSFLVVILGGLFIGSLLIFFAPLISSQLLSGSETALLRFAGSCVIFVVFTSIAFGVLSGLELFKLNAYLQVATSIISALLILISAYFFSLNITIYSMMIGFLITALISAFIIYRISIGRFIFSIKKALQHKEILYRYSLPAFISGSAITLTLWYSQSMYIKNVDYLLFGVFAVANQFYLLIGSLNRIFGSVILPVYISTATTIGKSVSLEKFNLGFSWFASIIIAVVLILFSGVIATVLGPDYQIENWDAIMSVVLLSAVIFAFKQGAVRVILEKDLMWYGVLENLLSSVALIFCAYSFLPYGIIGLPVAILVSNIVSVIVIFTVLIIKGCLPEYFIKSKSVILVWLGVAGFFLMPLTNAAPLVIDASSFLSVMLIIFSGYVYWFRLSPVSN